MKDFEIKTAKRMLSVLDLTSLHSETDVNLLCEKAVSSYGNVAGVCVLPTHIDEVRDRLKGTDIKIVTVANFPQGDLNVHRTVTEIRNVLEQGVDEIDVVFPFRVFLNRQSDMCLSFLERVREESEGACLKVVLETGALDAPKWIKKATEIVIRSGANFIKTSTGRYPKKATFTAVDTILETIRELKAGDKIGIKISGGIDRYDIAAKYLELTIDRMGVAWVNSEFFRIGSSKLYDSLIEKINQ